MKSIIKYIATIILLWFFAAACKTVPVTGRKQLNLVPNGMIQSIDLEATNLARRFYRPTWLP